MKKIPTVFERDWEGDRSRVVDQVHPGCEWVLAGEGVPTRKHDGTCCLIRGGQLYKRQELKAGQVAPGDFEEEDFDPETGKRVGWRPVGDGPEDRWHRAAVRIDGETPWPGLPDGTYELCGPKVQGNPEALGVHMLIPHGIERMIAFPRTFEAIRAAFAHPGWTGEGIVFHHPDGRMAKIKMRDFGLKRRPSES